MRDRVEFLMDHGDPQVQCVFGVGDVDGFSIEFDFAVIGMVKAEKTFHQCRFTGSVFTHQRMNGSLAYIDRYVIESLHSRELF